MNIPDLERMVLSFAGVYYPVDTLSRLSLSTLRNQNNLIRDMRQSWIQMWTPTFCNVLRWERCNQWRYRAITLLTPTIKDILQFTRHSNGLHPIFPGDRHYPTSRVRFHPQLNTNDRYFR